ncbi:MAG: hypothetical protein H6719_24495 [Sandaracinaceae bacterium]|nr:hypothetical protein [Sandaracinaceae bacterium]
MSIDLQRLAAAIQARTPDWVLEVKVGEMINAEGEPALRVTLIIEARPELYQDGPQLEAAVDAVHAAVEQMEVDRWPYTRFVSVDEAA